MTTLDDATPLFSSMSISAPSECELWLDLEKESLAWTQAASDGDLLALTALTALASEPGQDCTRLAMLAGEALSHACSHGRESIVRLLAPLCTARELASAVCFAAEGGHSACIEALGIERLQGPLLFGSKQRDPMAYACLANQARCVELLAPLLGLGARDTDGINGLMHCAQSGRAEAFAALISRYDGQRAPGRLNLLMLSCRSGAASTTALALRYDDPCERDVFGMDALMHCASDAWNPQRDTRYISYPLRPPQMAYACMELVASDPRCDFNARDLFGLDAMAHACISLRMERVVLLEKAYPGWSARKDAQGRRGVDHAREVIARRAGQGPAPLPSELGVVELLKRWSSVAAEKADIEASCPRSSGYAEPSTGPLTHPSPRKATWL